MLGFWLDRCFLAFGIALARCAFIFSSISFNPVNISSNLSNILKSPDRLTSLRFLGPKAFCSCFNILFASTVVDAHNNDSHSGHRFKKSNATTQSVGLQSFATGNDFFFLTNKKIRIRVSLVPIAYTFCHPASKFGFHNHLGRSLSIATDVVVSVLSFFSLKKKLVLRSWFFFF